MERTEEMTRASAPGKILDGSYIDWAAILAGAVLAVAIGSVFTGFGAALGLSTISAEPGEGSFNLLMIVSAVWIVVTLVASYMTGGYITGRMRRRIDGANADEVTTRDGINGLVVWGLGIVVSVMFLGSVASTTVSTAGSLASAAGSAVETVATAAGSVVGGAAQGALSAAGAMVPEEVKKDPMEFVSSTLLRPAQVAAGVSDQADVALQATGILGNVVSTGEITDVERGYLISAVVANTGATQPEAATRVDAAIAAAQSARADAAKIVADTKAEAEKLAADAKDAAIKAAEVARVSAVLSAFLLAAAALVAAVAAYVSAVRGGRHRDAGRIFGGFAYRG